MASHRRLIAHPIAGQNVRPPRNIRDNQVASACSIFRELDVQQLQLPLGSTCHSMHLGSPRSHSTDASRENPMCCSWVHETGLTTLESRSPNPEQGSARAFIPAASGRERHWRIGTGRVSRTREPCPLRIHKIHGQELGCVSLSQLAHPCNALGKRAARARASIFTKARRSLLLPITPVVPTRWHDASVHESVRKHHTRTWLPGPP